MPRAPRKSVLICGSISDAWKKLAVDAGTPGSAIRLGRRVDVP